jgi:Protein of unknown function (DUF1186)
MELAEIIEQLKYNETRIFPREAVEGAISQQAAITPVLIETLKECKNNFDELLEDSGYILHIYALYFLAQFREKAAYSVIIDFFSTPGDAAMDITGDVVTEDLGRIIASVFDGNLDPIKQLIENQQANEYVRGAAIDSLMTLLAQDIITRQEVVEYFRELFQGKIERNADNYLLNKLIIDACDLCPLELKPYIDQAFDEDLVDPMFIAREEVDESVELGIDEALEKLRDDHHHVLIDNIITEMEWWAGFNEPKSQPSYTPFNTLNEFTKSSSPKKSQAIKKKKMQQQTRRKNRPKKK